MLRSVTWFYSMNLLHKSLQLYVSRILNHQNVMSFLMLKGLLILENWLVIKSLLMIKSLMMLKSFPMVKNLVMTESLLNQMVKSNLVGLMVLSSVFTLRMIRITTPSPSLCKARKQKPLNFTTHASKLLHKIQLATSTYVAITTKRLYGLYL